MLRRLVPLVIATIVLCGEVAVSAPPVKHPNLLLSRDEIEQVKAKIDKHPWAAQLFERVKKLSATSDAWPATPFGGTRVRSQAVCYVITGDRAYADQAGTFCWVRLATTCRDSKAKTLAWPPSRASTSGRARGAPTPGRMT